MSFLRSMKARLGNYLRTAKNLVIREIHANTSPLRASLSLALGILVGFSPFYGIHIIIVVPLAFLFRLNRPLVLLSVSTTILPMVPLWLAAGIFTGKLVLSIDKANAIVVFCRDSMPFDLFDRAILALVGICRHILPEHLFEKILQGSNGPFLAKFVQWFVGCSVLAVVSAIVTLCITYPILLRISVLRKNRLQGVAVKKSDEL
jgi:uncharacterized protein (DUF2062 family)